MHPRTIAKLQRAMLTTAGAFAGIVVVRKLGWVGKHRPWDPASWAEIQQHAPSYFLLALILGALVFFYSGNDPE